MSPDTNPTPSDRKPPYRTPHLNDPPAHIMIVLDLTLLLLELQDITRQLETAILKLHSRTRLEPPQVAPAFRSRTAITDAERARLAQDAPRAADFDAPDDTDWDSVLNERAR